MKGNNISFTERLQVLLAILCICSATLILHSIGISENLYATLSWFDLITHGLGGIGIAFGIIYTSVTRVLIWLPATLAILITWELFEVFIVQIGTTPHALYVLDTFSDISIALLTTTTALYIYQIKKSRTT